MSGQVEQQDNIWLVKSNSSVLGPYKFDEVVDSIFKGDIHVLDEIKGPFERWRPIRDHSLFNAAIERLKATTYARREYTVTDTVDVNTEELTQTSTNTGFEDTKTITSTGDLTASGIDSGTPTPPRFQPPARNLRYPLPNEPVHEPPKVYPQPPQKPKPPSQFPIAFFLTLVIIVGGAVLLTMVGLKEGSDGKRDRSAEFGRLTEDAMLELNSGFEDEAFNNFRKALAIDRDNVDVKLKLAPLLIQLRKPTLDGGIDGVKLASEILANNRFGDVSPAHIIIALHYSYKALQESNISKVKNLREESVKELKAALAVEEGDYTFSALVNISYELLRLDIFGEAETYLTRANEVAANKSEGISHYLATRAYIAMGMKTNNPAWFDTAISSANSYSREKSDFLQEILFLKAIAQRKLGKSQEMLVQSVQEFMDIDPELTTLHVHEIMWNKQIFDWNDMGNWCADLMNALDAYHGDLVRGFCAYKQGSIVEAESIFQKLASQKPDDGIVFGMKIATDLKKDERNAAANIQLLPSMRRPKLASSILIRDCLEQRDLECARKVDASFGAKILDLYQFWYEAESQFEENGDRYKKAIKNADELSNKRFKYVRLLKVKK